MKKIIAVLFALTLLASQSSAATAADAYASKWGTFKTQTFSGTGDDVITLSAAATAGTITATHSGEENFVIWGLNTSMAQSGLQVNTIGAYSGTTEFGFGFSTKKTKGFEITADGDWTVTVKPLGAAPKLPTSGNGDGVFKYSGSTPVWKVTHSGNANFVIWEYCTNGQTDLVVNKIGSYKGTLKGIGGTCIVAVHADGAWSIKK
jgi:hypothetical protein